MRSMEPCGYDETFGTRGTLRLGWVLVVLLSPTGPMGARGTLWRCLPRYGTFPIPDGPVGHYEDVEGTYWGPSKRNELPRFAIHNSRIAVSPIITRETQSLSPHTRCEGISRSGTLIWARFRFKIMTCMYLIDLAAFGILMGLPLHHLSTQNGGPRRNAEKVWFLIPRWQPGEHLRGISGRRLHTPPPVGLARRIQLGCARTPPPCLLYADLLLLSNPRIQIVAINDVVQNL